MAYIYSLYVTSLKNYIASIGPVNYKFPGAIYLYGSLCSLMILQGTFVPSTPLEDALSLGSYLFAEERHALLRSGCLEKNPFDYRVLCLEYTFR